MPSVFDIAVNLTATAATVDKDQALSLVIRVNELEQQVNNLLVLLAQQKQVIATYAELLRLQDLDQNQA